MSSVDQVPLLEGLVALGVEAEVVESLGEVLGLVEAVQPVPGSEEGLLRPDSGGRETNWPDVLGRGKGTEP